MASIKKKEKRYIILSKIDRIELAKEVEGYINNGWKLQGGICHSIVGNGAWGLFSQALIK